MDKNLKKHELHDSSDTIFPTPEQFLESAKPQEFALPMPMMKYIWENPTSPEVYQKLIKTCKFFFLKNPILVMKNLKYRDGSKWRYCNSDECVGYECKHEKKKIDMDNIHGKIWFSKRFDVRSYANPLLVSTIIPQIYQCSIQFLKLNGHLTFNQLKFFSSGVKEFYFYSCIVKYDESGEYVSLEDITTLFSDAEELFMDFGSQPANAFCKSYDDFIDACKTIRKVKLFYLPADFDVHEFYIRLKNSKNHALINIYSRGPADRLNQVINEIMTKEIFEFVPPVIDGGGVRFEKLEKMYEIRKKEAAKYR